MNKICQTNTSFIINLHFVKLTFTKGFNLAILNDFSGHIIVSLISLSQRLINDKILSNIIRKTNKHSLIVVNKCDEYNDDILVHQFYELGIKDIVPISSLNGRLTGDLLDEIQKKLNSMEMKIINNYLNMNIGFQQISSLFNHQFLQSNR